MQDAFADEDEFSDSGDNLSGAAEQTVTAEVCICIHLCAYCFTLAARQNSTVHIILDRHAHTTDRTPLNCNPYVSLHCLSTQHCCNLCVHASIES